MDDNKLIINRLETIADVLESGVWSKETVVEELLFIANELRVVDEIRNKSAETRNNI